MKERERFWRGRGKISDRTRKDAFASDASKLSQEKGGEVYRKQEGQGEKEAKEDGTWLVIVLDKITFAINASLQPWPKTLVVQLFGR